MTATQTKPKTAKIVTPETEVLEVTTPYEQGRLILSAQETDGQFMVAQTTVLPGGCPPMHSHLHEDELWVVTEGQFEFIVNGETRIVGPGTVVYSPAGDVHRFRCVSETPGKFTILVTGGNFERFFGRWMEALGAMDLEAGMRAAKEHGITFHEPIGAATTGR
ncbi:MAG: cupin domain-containing protein [Fimbriimonas sp.]